MAGMKRIAILTSGGDAPGMNAAIRAATLIGDRPVPRSSESSAAIGACSTTLSSRSARATSRGILREGGTILGSARCKEFHQREVRDRARAILAKREIDGLIVIGGNGSLTGALAPRRSDGDRRRPAAQGDRHAGVDRQRPRAAPGSRSASTPR